MWPDGYVPPSVAGGKEGEKRDRIRQRKEAKGHRAREGEVHKPEEAEHVSSALVVKRTADEAEHGNSTNSATGNGTVGNARANNGRNGGKKKGNETGGVKEGRKTSGGRKEEKQQERRLIKSTGEADSPILPTEGAESKVAKKKKKKNKDNVSEL